MEPLNENINIKGQNNTLNFLKAIACIAVVFIHVRFPGTFGEGIAALSRSAVALFFIISGYYLYRPNRKIVAKKLQKRTKHIAIMTFVAFLIYFVWESGVRWVGSGIDSTFNWYKKLFTWQNLLQVILYSYDPVVGHLWFLLALLEAYLIFMLINKIKGEKIVCLLAIPLLEIHIIIMSLSTILNWGISMAIFRSVWFYGLPFLSLGYALKEKEEWLNRHVSTRLTIISVILGIGLTLLERFLIGNLQIFNGTILFVLSTFLLAVRYPNVKLPKAFMVLGSKYSSEIYIYHWIICEIFAKLQSVLNITGVWFGWCKPICVFIVTLLCSMILVALKDLIHKKGQGLKTCI